MKIGIIIHSNTGHTLEVAHELEKSLSAHHLVTIEKVSSINEEESQRGNVVLKDNPQLDQYDLVVLGSPIHGFMISKTMIAYLKQLADHPSTKVFLYVTHFFPTAGLGGKQGIRQFKKLIQDKKLIVTSSAIIPWTFGRKKAISNLLNDLQIVISEKNEGI